MRGFLARRAFALARSWRVTHGFAIRGRAVAQLLKNCGPDPWIGPELELLLPEQIAIGGGLRTMQGVQMLVSGEGWIEIGDDCRLNAYVQLDAGPSGGIRIGDGLLVGPNVVMRNCDHRWRDPDTPIREQGHSCRDIVIGDEVWIAANAVILGGVTLEEGCVVAAGAVVRRGTYGPNEVLAGNPAEVVTRRGSET